MHDPSLYRVGVEPESAPTRPELTVIPLTRYQRDTIRAAVEIFNCLPICPHHGVRHLTPHMADYELLILADASAILEEWDIRPVYDRETGLVAINY